MAERRQAIKLFLATNEGVVLLERDAGEWEVVHSSLAGQRVTSIIAREGVILAGTVAGIFRSEDSGQTWMESSGGLSLPHVRWLAYHPAVSDREFAGTEPAAIFMSHDGGTTWSERSEVAELRERYGWRLPYSPAAGCIRGFAFHGQRGYAAAEDGALLRSDDQGESWALAPGSPGEPLHRPGAGQIHSDVHSVAVHPSSADLVLAPTGGGLFSSGDGGATWENLYRCYCRAVWWDPADPRHMIFGPADGVDRNGRLEETSDGGTTWQRVNEGTGAPWPQHMAERLYQWNDALFSVLSNGELLVSSTSLISWRTVPVSVDRANALAVLE
jgi:hypothetical protein